MGKPSDDDLDEAKRLMGALVQMKPKPHDAMKVAMTFGVIDRSYSQATLICWGGIACLCWLVMGYTAQIECSSQPQVRPP